MPSFSSVEHSFSRKQGPMTHYLYEFLKEPERCQEEQQDREYGMNFDSLDIVYSERRRQRPRYLINLKREHEQSFSISSVTDLQPEGRLKR